MTFRDALSPAEVWAALDLRRRVFADGMGVPMEVVHDGHDDPPAVHLIVEDDGAVLGTLRLLPDGERVKLGHVAVDADHRGEGLGTALLGLADQRARELGGRRITLNALLEVAPLYEALGYVRDGSPFDHKGMTHVRMEKRLT